MEKKLFTDPSAETKIFPPISFESVCLSGQWTLKTRRGGDEVNPIYEVILEPEKDSSSITFSFHSFKSFSNFFNMWYAENTIEETKGDFSVKDKANTNVLKKSGTVLLVAIALRYLVRLFTRKKK